MNLTFDNFELELLNELTGGCWWKDYVEIIVAPNSNGQMYCGSLPCLTSECSAPTGTFSGTSITIKFHSDGADNMHGAWISRSGVLLCECYFRHDRLQ